MFTIYSARNPTPGGRFLDKIWTFGASCRALMQSFGPSARFSASGEAPSRKSIDGESGERDFWLFKPRTLAFAAEVEPRESKRVSVQAEPDEWERTAPRQRTLYAFGPLIHLFINIEDQGLW